MFLFQRRDRFDIGLITRFVVGAVVVIVTVLNHTTRVASIGHPSNKTSKTKVRYKDLRYSKTTKHRLITWM